MGLKVLGPDSCTCDRKASKLLLFFPSRLGNYWEMAENLLMLVHFHCYHSFIHSSSTNHHSALS